MHSGGDLVTLIDCINFTETSGPEEDNYAPRREFDCN